MRGIRAVAVVSLTLGLVALALPAEGLSKTISDPPGDAGGAGLDITSAQLSNQDHAFTATITFVTDTEGHLIVAVGSRDGQLFRVISEHPSHGSDTTFLLNHSGQTVPCDGLSSSWDRSSAVVRLKLPSTCLYGGDYGAVHSWVLTEDDSGRDVDYAPVDSQGDIRFTSWIPRG